MAASEKDSVKYAKQLQKDMGPNSTSQVLIVAVQKFIDLAENVQISKLIARKTLYLNFRLHLSNRDRNLRAFILKALLLTLVDDAAIDDFSSCNLQILVSKALERDNKKYLPERVQALKIVRQISQINATKIPIPLIRAIIALAENKGDDLRILVIDTLRETIVRAPQLCISCGALRTLIESMLDTEVSELLSPITFTLLNLIDSADTRQLISPLHIHRIISVFTDTDAPDATDKDSITAAAHKILITMLRSWTGVFFLSSDPEGLKNLSKYLALPSGVRGGTWTRWALFDLLFHILDVVKPPSADTRFSHIKQESSPNLLYNYIVTVMIAFIECGFFEVLIHLGMSADYEFSSLARRLLGEIFALSSNLLPNSHLLKLNSLSSVMESALEFSTENRENSVSASYLMSDLSKFLNNRTENSDFTQGPAQTAGIDLRPVQRESIYDIDTETLINVTSYFTADNSTKELPLTSPLSSNEIDSMVQKSNVLNPKNDWTLWNLDIIMELLSNSSHSSVLSHLLRVKFIKKLISFIKPSLNFFPKLHWNSKNLQCVPVFVKLFKILCSSDEGCQDPFFLETIDEILHELKEEINKDSSRAFDESDSCAMSLTNLHHRLSCEYFTLLGILSSTPNGMKILNNHKLFEMLKNITPLNSKDFLCRRVLIFLYYCQDRNTRDLFKHYLIHGSPSLKRVCISHLRLLFRQETPNFSQWGIDMLVNCLNDKPDIALCALSVLEEVCDKDEDALKTLIRLQPYLQFVKMGRMAHPLITRFCSTKEGISFLQKDGMIDKHFDEWKNTLTKTYVEGLETALVTSLSEGITPVRYGGLKLRTTQDDSYFHRLHFFPWNVFLVEETKGREVHLLVDSFIDTQPLSHYTSLQSTAHPIGTFNGNNKQSPSTDAFSPQQSSPRSKSPRKRSKSPPLKSVQKTTQLDSPYGKKKVTPDDIMDDAKYNASCEEFLASLNSKTGRTRFTSANDMDRLHTVVEGIVLDSCGNPKPIPVDSKAVLRAKLSVGIPQINQDTSHIPHICTLEKREKQLSPTKLFVEEENILWHFTSSLCDKNNGLIPSVDQKTFMSSLLFVGVRFRIPVTFTYCPPCVSLPPHMFRELAISREGTDYLQKSGIVSEYIKLIKPLEDCSLDKRAALWAIGQIGSTPRGFKLIETHGAPMLISEQAKRSSILSIRGTCFYVLGLLSLSEIGRQRLKQLGWESPIRSELGIAVPTDIQEFLKISFLQNKQQSQKDTISFGISETPKNDSTHELKLTGKILLGHISNLINHVSRKKSHAYLKRMRRENPKAFTSPQLFYEAIKLINSYTFQAKARQFILYDLFDAIKWDETTIKVFDQSYIQSNNELMETVF